jgi:hypothetical protein
MFIIVFWRNRFAGSSLLLGHESCLGSCSDRPFSHVWVGVDISGAEFSHRKEGFEENCSFAWLCFFVHSCCHSLSGNFRSLGLMRMKINEGFGVVEMN